MEDDIRKTVMNSQSKSCILDALHTNILKEFVLKVLPYMVDMCNASLRKGSPPLSQCYAIITPQIKKPNANHSDVKNYRPISIITFASKLVEKHVCRQQMAFIE